MLHIENKGQSVGIPTDLFREVLIRHTYNAQFNFDSKIYSQRDGVAVGSILKPILVDIFTDQL